VPAPIEIVRFVLISRLILFNAIVCLGELQVFQPDP
jgi:hypothetical protein